MSETSHHHSEDIFENRKQFQLERMILFSDAVFAIAITLLVIEIRIPQITEVGMITQKQLAEDLIALVPQIAGFIISFFVVGLFWTTHHRMFGYVIDFDGGLIWLNIVLLMTVALLPFTTSVTSEYGYLNLGFGIYAFNMGLIGFMTYFIWLRISNPKRKLSSISQNKNLIAYGRVRSFVIACIFLSGAVFMIPDNTFINYVGRYIFFLIFPAIIILKKRYKIKKY